jgi:hypothetical protein
MRKREGTIAILFFFYLLAKDHSNWQAYIAKKLNEKKRGDNSHSFLLLPPCKKIILTGRHI